MQFIPLILTVTAGVAGAVQVRNQGIIADNEAKAQARVEATAGKGRELDRRRQLLRALSSQNAAAGAAGVELGGSLGGIIRSDIREASNDLLVDSANVSARRSALLASGRNARRQGNLGAVVSLLDTGAKASKLLPPKKAA